MRVCFGFSAWFEFSFFVQPRGTAKGVGMGYAGHVPLLFGGTKQTTGVAPSLLNGSDLDGLDSQPSVNVRATSMYPSNQNVFSACVRACSSCCRCGWVATAPAPPGR